MLSSRTSRLEFLGRLNRTVWSKFLNKRSRSKVLRFIFFVLFDILTECRLKSKEFKRFKKLDAQFVCAALGNLEIYKFRISNFEFQTFKLSKSKSSFKKFDKESKVQINRFLLLGKGDSEI